jgi:hypothetical protein
VHSCGREMQINVHLRGARIFEYVV